MIIPISENQHTLAKRFIPSIVAIAAAFLALQSSCSPKLFIFPSLALALLANASAFELAAILQRIGLRMPPRLIAWSALVPMLACFFGAGQSWIVGLGFFAAFAVPVGFAMRQPIFETSWLGCCLSTLYLGVPFLLLQDMILPKAPHEALQMRWHLAFFIAAVKGSDIGGFLIGHYLGRRRLAPRISPGKTWEGALAGVVLANFVSMLVAWSAPVGVFHATPSALSLAAVILAIASQASDLFESYLKRLAKVKDSGSLKGFGGILDLMDSILGSTVVFWILLRAGML